MLLVLLLVSALGSNASVDNADSSVQYQAAGRRDPFVNPTAPIDGGSHRSSCGNGLAGWLVGDLSLQGTVQILKDTAQLPGGFVAVFTAPDKKTYFARPGQRLFDGRIVEIVKGKVTFQQDLFDHYDLSLVPRPDATKIGVRLVPLELPR